MFFFSLSLERANDCASCCRVFIRIGLVFAVAIAITISLAFSLSLPLSSHVLLVTCSFLDLNAIIAVLRLLFHSLAEMAEENEKQREKEMEEIIAFVRIKASVNGRMKKTQNSSKTNLIKATRRNKYQTTSNQRSEKIYINSETSPAVSIYIVFECVLSIVVSESAFFDVVVACLLLLCGYFRAHNFPFKCSIVCTF